MVIKFKPVINRIKMKFAIGSDGIAIEYGGFELNCNWGWRVLMEQQ
jgi:hypothetical protein